ncbi:uncharacterized protein LOC124273955 [Haliotis rubra]|uniref:uncharacterized protein LOC124273955 n=1 Tax=Haliotis rubra TaxID=36100 RepID=UPI001EE58E0D|nr:uncharacterized protein LOC124273955 [Haliotis rubra]
MEKSVYLIFLLATVCSTDDVENLLQCKHIELSDSLTNCRKSNLQVDILKTSSAASRSTGFVDYEELFVSATQATCSQLDQYTTQLTCKHNVIDECLADEYKSLLPDQYNLAEAVRYLCTNLFDLNDQCLRDYMLNMGECLLSRGFDNPAQLADNSVKENTCKLYSYASTCVATTFRPCGVIPLKIYRKAMTYLAPRACSGAVKVTAVVLTLAITTCKALFEMLL